MALRAGLVSVFLNGYAALRRSVFRIGYRAFRGTGSGSVFLIRYAALSGWGSVFLNGYVALRAGWGNVFLNRYVA